MTPCGCEIEEGISYNGAAPPQTIRYCKLHGAAPEMLTALKNMVKRFEDYAHEKGHPWCGCTYCNTNSLIERVEDKS